MVRKTSVGIGIVFLALSILVFAISLHAQYGTGRTSNGTVPQYVASLWIAGSDGLINVSAPDGSLISQISSREEISAVAVDSLNGKLWAFGGSTLYAYSLDGTLLLRTSVQYGCRDRDGDNGGGGDNGRSVLEADPMDGSLWLGVGQKLFHVDTDGKISLSLDLSQPVRGLAWDGVLSRLWVATQKNVFSCDESGVQSSALTLPKNAQVMDIAFEASSNVLLVGLDGLLQSYGPDRNLLLQQPLENIRRISADGRGSVWIATKKSLARADSSGKIQFFINYLKKNVVGTIADIAADPADGSVWLIDVKNLTHVSANGSILPVKSRQPDKNCRLRAISIYRDTTPPTLVISSPAQNSFINTASPTVVFSYNDTGSGIDPLSLALTVNGQTAQASCIYGASGASCTLNSPLPDGTNTISAAVKDYEGNVSQPGEVGFSVDTIPPVVSIRSPLDGLYTNQAPQTITGVLSEPGTLLLNGQAVAVLSDMSFSLPVTLAQGLNTFSLSATDRAGNTGSAILHLTLDTTPPTITIDSPQNGLLTNRSAQTITGHISNEGTLLINGQAVSVEEGNAFTFPATLSEGANAFSLAAQDRAGNAASASLTLTLDTIPPVPVDSSRVRVGSVSGGMVTVSAGAGSAEAGALITVTNETTGQSVTGTVAPDGSFSIAISAGEGDSLSITLTDRAGNTSSSTSASAVPPDPAVIAPSLDPTAPTSIDSATSFLYTGSNPIQKGVGEGTIDPGRAAVIRGKVLTRDGSALPGVMITILNHPEFGQTLSRADGMFDMAVNGGGQLTVSYRKSAYLPSQRQVNIPWRDYALCPDVVMVEADSKVSAIDLTAATPIQVAQGNTVTDTDGTRTATLLIPQGTTASMVLPDGTTQALSSLHIRATEYTVGSSGPNAMPATLPSASGYTYCVELSADEALTAGAKSVTFSNPIINYVENFLNFPPGMPVPVGYYDSTKGRWIASSNGLVVKILGTTNGMADLDIDGSNRPAGPDALSSLGITDAERTQLALLYSPGQGLWRVAIAHFSPWDFNWPFAPPTGSKAPNQPSPTTFTPIDPCLECGSIIGCESQTLGEEVGITGTGLRLRYQNDRTLGHAIDRIISIPLTGASVPENLKRVDLTVTAAGRSFQSSFPATPNQTYQFTWDRMDAYNRMVPGEQPITINIGYVYPGVYLTPSEKTGYEYQSYFQHFSYYGTPATGDRARQEVTLWQKHVSTIGAYSAGGTGLGGWTLDVFHFYDPFGKRLYLGDGSQRSARGMIFDVISTAAGNGIRGFAGDGGPAVRAELNNPRGVGVGPDGSIYVADLWNNNVRRVGPDGTITTVAGNGTMGYSGDGGPATQAALSGPSAVSVGSDGSIYIVDSYNYRIRRVGPDGIITTIAGNGTVGDRGDGGPATRAQLYYPCGVAPGPDGSIYIADFIHIRRVGPDGIISTVAGNGSGDYNGDGEPATRAGLNTSGVSLAQDGTIYIADSGNNRIRRVGPDGIISTVAGNGMVTSSGDGGLATEAGFYPSCVAVAPDGSIYIADIKNYCIRRVGTDGIITTVAGNGIWSYSGDGGPATRAGISAMGVAVGPEGSFYIADAQSSRVRVVSKSPLPGFGLGDILIPSEDGSEIYHFDHQGKHLSTMQPLTGTTLYQFGYDGSGHLSTVTDASSNTVTIEHDGSGNPTAIISPYGQQTTLAVDSNGYLANVTDPAGNAYSFTYTTGGLMLSMTDPNSETYQFTYDSFGRLMKDSDPAGGSKTLARTDIPNGYSVGVTTGLNRTTTYTVQQFSAGGIDRITVSPDGTRSEVITGTDGSKDSTSADGTTQNLVQGPDPRFGMLTPLPQSTTTKTPGGLTLTTEMSRTVSLNDTRNSLSLRSQTDTIGINNVQYQRSFDASTNTFTTTTPAGRQETSRIDAAGKVVFKQANSLAPTSYTYDSRGRLSSIAAQTWTSTRSMSLAYDPNGFLSSLSDSLGRSLGFNHDAAGRVVSQILPDGSAVSFQYDGTGNLTSITPPGRPAHVFTYTPVDQASSYSAPGGAATNYSYNIDRQLVRVTRPSGKGLDFAYDSVGKPSNLTLPEGQISYAYDTSTGKLNQVSRSSGNDQAGNSRDEQISYGFDGPLVTLQTSSGTLNQSIGYSYDNYFRLSRLTYAGGYENYTYDADGLLTQAGAFTISRNGDTGLPESISAQLPATYSSLLEPLLAGSAAFHQSTRRTAWIGPILASSFGTDIDSTEPVLTDAPTTGLMAAADMGLQLCVGNYFMTGLDIEGAPAINAGQSETYSAMALYSDGSSYPTDATFSLSPTTAATISADGVLTAGQVATNETVTVNAFSPPSWNATRDVVIVAAGSAPVLTSLAIDGPASVRSGANASYTAKASYSDGSSRAVNATFSLGSTSDAAITPDGAFRAGQVSWDETVTVRASYAEGGFSETASMNVTIVSTPIGALSLNRTFNGFGELDGESHNIAGLAVSSWTVTRNDAGQIIGKTETVNDSTSTYTYTYDPAGRLLGVEKDGVSVEEYGYGQNGTRSYEKNTLLGIAARDMTYSDDDHILSAGDTTFQYDTDGFLASKTNGGQTTYFTYSSLGELLKAVLPDGTIIEYVYDPLGRRIAKKVNGSVTEKYLWQGKTRLLAVFDADENLVMRFQYADGRMPLSMTKGGTNYYFCYDQVGSLRLVSDTFGNVVKQIDYDSFGNILSDSNPTFTIPFGFAGGLYDNDTGLVHFGSRDYDPDTGAWTAKDPILFNGGDTNLYGYCLEDPINFIDPNGKNIGVIGGIIGGSIGGPPGAVIGAAVGIIAGAAIGQWMWDHWVANEDINDKPVPTPPIPDNPSGCPGEDWVWKGTGPPESGKGNWVNDKTGQKLHPDLNHLPPKGPHWGVTNPDGSKWDYFPGKGWKPSS